MPDFGIICEFNPMHNGHVRLINEARDRGAERIVCVMSGNSVQRGELAVADKYTRAEMAVRCGADLVLELPYPYSSASAEYFALAGVDILAQFADNIIFGSECGDIEYLSSAADVCAESGFREAVAARIQNGDGAAAAYFTCLAERGFSNLSSNDILGIEYIRAINRRGYSVTPHTLKRDGAAFNDTVLVGGENPSASAIRALLAGGETIGELYSFMPKEAADMMAKAFANGTLTDMNEIDAAILAFFRLHDASYFEGIAEAGGGLANRICSLARECTDAKEMLCALKTKKYTDAHLRRALLFCMTGVKHSSLDAPIAYTALLAANERGRELLSKNRKTRAMLVVTKPADAPACEQTDINNRLDTLFALARKEKNAASAMLTKKAYIQC